MNDDRREERADRTERQGDPVGVGAEAGLSQVRRPSVWQLAWPSMLSNLLFSLGGLVAMKVVGGLGASAIAAVTSGNQIFFALQAVMFAISAGTTAMVARAWGAGDFAEAIAVTKVSLVVCCAAAAVATVPGVIVPYWIASVFGLDAETTAISADYIRWISVFNLIFAVNLIIGSALRAAGDAMTPLWTGIATNLVYLALIYLFVYGAPGFPSMGVAGAAIANGVAFTFSAILLWWLWVRGKLMLPWDNKGYWTRERVRELMHIGYPAGVEQVVFRVGFFIFLGVIGAYYGTAAFSAYGIGVNILSLCFVVGFGFSISASTLVGQHLGANEPLAAFKAGWRSLGYAFASMLVVGGLIIAFAEPLARFMIADEEVIWHTVPFIYILGAMMPLMAIEFAIGGALRGAGDTRFPLRATLVGLLGMRCGLAIIFTWLEFEVVWVYAALIADYLVKGAMLLHRFRSGRWRYVFRQQSAARGT